MMVRISEVMIRIVRVRVRKLKRPGVGVGALRSLTAIIITITMARRIP